MQMHKYLIQVPLRYIKRPFCDENPEVVRKIRWEVVNPFNTTMKYIYNGNVKKVNVEVIGDSKNGIRICTDELLGSSKDDALKIVRKIAKKICINLSFSAQKQLDNFEEFHSYFYWEDRQIHINEVDTKVTCKRTVSEDKHNVTLAVNEPILSNCSRFREQVDMELTRSINLLGLNNLELCVEKNPACKFMLAAFYAALGNRDISSQYFNLFTIIEYLEQNEMKEYPECRQGLLSEKSKKDLLKKYNCLFKRQ